MIQDQTSNTLFWSRDRTLPSLSLSSSLSSQSTSGPSSTRSGQARRNSRPQLQASSSSPTPSTPPTTYPSSSDASSSTDSFKTADSLPSPAAPSPASQSPSQANPSSERSNPLGSSLNLNKPLPILPPPSRPPSSYGYGPFAAAAAAPPPPAYTPFDPHALLFHISFPYIYASSNDASSAPTPRYQVSVSHTRAGRPHQLLLRRLTRSESRRVAFTSTGSSNTPTASTSALVPFDVDLTLYTATYYSPRATVPEIRGCKASTVAGRLVPSSASPFAVAAGRSWKGRGANWELCRLTREKTDGGRERDGRWEYREKEAWSRDVVFAATERTEKGVSGGVGEQEEDPRRVRRKGSLGLSLRRGLGMTTGPATTTTTRVTAAREQRCRYDGNEDAINDVDQPSQTRRHQHGIFEWRAGTVSLSSPSPSSPSLSSTTATTAIAPSQLVATSGAITTTKIVPINLPVHAATAPPATSTNELRGAGIDADVDAQGSSRRRAGTTSTAATTGTRMGMGMMRRRPSSTALALRRVASRVSLRTTDNIVVDNDNGIGIDAEAPSSTPLMKREREKGRQRKMHQTSTRRWLRLEQPLERRALDALVMAWVVGVWMDMDGQGPGLGEDGSEQV